MSNLDSVRTPAPIALNGHLSAVLFDGDDLVLADHNGQPYVAMKALVAAMGLAWQPQHAKLTERFASTVTIIVMVADDGKLREMVCLPLRKLPGWLYSINPGKISAELRPKVLRYQAECDEVLWRHWTNQQPLNSQRGLTAAEHNGLLKRRAELRRELGACKSEAAALEVYTDYLHASTLLGIHAGGLQALAPGMRQHAVPGA
jgi:hypothetical protein